MSSEFNDLSLINADGILLQDEWNGAVYSKYIMQPLEEDSSRDLVENIRYPEYNDSRGHAYEEKEKKEDNRSEQVLQQAAVNSVAQTFVAMCVGAFLIAGSYASAIANNTGVKTDDMNSSNMNNADVNTSYVSTADVSDFRWEWSADHTSANVVLVTEDGEVKIPADVEIEENVYCTTDGAAVFHAKAPAGDGKNYYGEYNETLPPKGHDFEVSSSGTDDSGAVYADYVCKTCGEHFVVNAEITLDGEGSNEEDAGQ